MNPERSVLVLAVCVAAGFAIAAHRYPATHIPETGPIEIPPSTVSGSALAYSFEGEEPESLFAETPAVKSAGALSEVFDRMGYDLDTILDGSDSVPRVILANLPPDLGDVREAKLRKAIFVRTVLPLVLQINEEILEERARAWRIWYDRHMSGGIEPEDELWLAAMAEKYRTRRGDLEALLKKADVIPPSLALAQAAEESGWGTSRFTRDGNALFGQWTSSRDGLVPEDPDDDMNHRIQAFASLADSVRAYALNLNAHRAYKQFRQRRATLRAAAAPLDGSVLATTLGRYSERGEDYIKTIRGHIRNNRLQLLDDARLSEGTPIRRLI